MRTLLTMLLSLLALPAPGQLSLRSPCFVACFLKPMASAASYPSGAPHYWKFENDLSDAVGACTLTDEGVDSYVAGKNNNCVVVTSGGVVTAECGLSYAGAFSIVAWAWPGTGSTVEIRGPDVPTAVVSMYDDVGTWKAHGGITSDTLSGGSVAYDAWSLLVLTYDGSSAFKFSVNGATFTTGTVTLEDTLGTTLAFVAANAASRFDECSTFTRALTQQEVADIWSPTFGP